MVALEIHRLSRHRNEPFVKCGCSGLTGDSLAARLHRAENASAEDAASSGSLFLDGINHLDPAAQGRLLHLLPDGSGTPPQGCHSMRVISSTTRNLEEEMKSGRFREELYYRINGVHLRLPPLRDRKEDIPALLEFFFKKYASLFERPEPNISESTMNLLLRHAWPGNIRELENVARKIVALGDEQLATHDLTAGNGTKAPDPLPDALKNPRQRRRARPDWFTEGGGAGSFAAGRASHDSEPTRANALEPEEERRESCKSATRRCFIN